jgi:ABC-type multidrug transport system fused ATPase/permease subunit
MKHLRHLNKYFLKYKWWIIPGSIFVVISNIFGVIPAQVIGYAFDLITENIKIYTLFNGFNPPANRLRYIQQQPALFWFAGYRPLSVERFIPFLYAANHHFNVEAYRI